MQIGWCGILIISCECKALFLWMLSNTFFQIKKKRNAKLLLSQSSGCQKSKMVLTRLKLSCQQSCLHSFLCGGSRGGSIFSLFLALRGHPHALLFTHAPSFHLQKQPWSIFKSLPLSLLPSFTQKDSCDYLCGNSFHLNSLNHICKVPFVMQSNTLPGVQDTVSHCSTSHRRIFPPCNRKTNPLSGH